MHMLHIGAQRRPSRAWPVVCEPSIVVHDVMMILCVSFDPPSWRNECTRGERICREPERPTADDHGNPRAVAALSVRGAARGRCGVAWLRGSTLSIHRTLRVWLHQAG
jgi:hypothetical protein